MFRPFDRLRPATKKAVLIISIIVCLGPDGYVSCQEQASPVEPEVKVVPNQSEQSPKPAGVEQSGNDSVQKPPEKRGGVGG